MTEQRPQRSRAPVFWGIGVAIAVLALLAVGILLSFGPQLRLDRELSSAFYTGDHRPAVLNDLLRVVTAPGLSVVRLVVFVPVVVWLVRRRNFLTAAYTVVAVALIGPLTTGLKDLIGRARPAFQNGGAQLSSFSYPSGHSSGIATLVTVALVLAWPFLRGGRRRLWLVAGVVVVVVVGLSRMWLGVHYLTDVLGGWSLGVAWSLGLAVAFGALPGGRAALTRAREGLRQDVVLAPDDGSLGPLLRVADDRLPPSAGYGEHRHSDVDVVAVVLDGSLHHRWRGDVPLAAGDVAVLRAGTGLDHDEVAGAGGARVLQCYLRSAQVGRAPEHEVHRGATGWVALGRGDARLWLGRAGDDVPPGLRLVVGPDGVTVDDAGPAPGARILVWQLDTARPDWAQE